MSAAERPSSSSEPLLPAERREADRDRVRTRIVDAARDLFASEGYDVVSMRRIAQRIGYTAGTVYNHFRDKRDLFTELCRRDWQTFAGTFIRAADVADPVERVRALGAAYIRFGLEHPSHYTLLFMTPFDPDEMTYDACDWEKRDDPTRDAFAALRGAVQAAISAGRFRPEYHDAQLVSQTLWAGVHGVVSLELTFRDDPWIEWRDVHERITSMLDALMHGLEMPSSSTRRGQPS